MDYSFLKGQKINTTNSLLGGVIVGVLAIVLIVFLIKKPIGEKINKTSAEILNARKELKTNRRLTKELPELEKKKNKLAQRLRVISSKLVPADTPVLWATEIVERQAAKEKLKVQNVDPGGITQLATTDKKNRKKTIAPYEEFRTAANLEGRTHQFGRFLAALEKEFPAMRMASFSLIPRGQKSAAQLTIKFTANYLSFSDTGFPPKIRPDFGAEALRPVSSE